MPSFFSVHGASSGWAAWSSQLASSLESGFYEDHILTESGCLLTIINIYVTGNVYTALMIYMGFIFFANWIACCRCASFWPCASCSVIPCTMKTHHIALLIEDGCSRMPQ